MNFESLPNEIIFDIFDYLNGTDVFHAFYDLKFRFNDLLHKQYRTFHFNLDSISKHQFDILCHKHFPIIINQIKTLNLSNGNRTPQQIDLFLSHILSLNRFTYLRSLSLSYLYTYETIMKIIDQCHQLCNLNHLKFNSCSFTVKQMYYRSIMNNIWSLPKLIHCELDIIVERELRFCLPTKISLSLERLSFSKCEASLAHINQLYKNTPNLKYLSIFIVNSGSKYQESRLSTIKNLNIYFGWDRLLNIFSFLQNIPNLYRLNITLSTQIIDGRQCKEFITKFLPKLRIFQFQMVQNFTLDENLQRKADQLIKSFRSPFWTDEHRWYVRCFISKRTVYLFTVNNTISFKQEIIPRVFLSTCPDDNLQNFCNGITDVYNASMLIDLIPSRIHFINIKHLTIQIPIDNEFWLIVPNLDKLRTLEISSTSYDCRSEIHDVFNRAPHLYKLTIVQRHKIPLQMSIFEYIHGSIRELDMLQYSLYLNEEQCITLCHSSIGSKCEILHIQVDKLESIIYLVSNMNNLRSLTVRYKEPICILQETNNENVLKDDDIVQWLKERLPSNCFISKTTIYSPTIHLWI